MTKEKKPAVAVAIPCYNEAVTIAKVVGDFRGALPDAAIHVFDNNSKDQSTSLAQQAGASVHRVRKQGKGHVMRAIFDSLSDFDAVLVVDGDDTYHATDAPKLLEPILGGEADMVVGNRLLGATDASMKRLHQVGNSLIVGIINLLFGTAHRDILSGYRAFSCRFVEKIPLLTAGFEVETELTLQALSEGLNVLEVPVDYRSRPTGSHSKLRSFQDGYRILLTAAVLLRDHRPLRLFGLASLVSFLVAAVAGALRLLNYAGATALPDSLLSGLVLLCAPMGVMAFGIGLIVNAINTRFREMKQIMERNRRLGE